MRERVTVLTRVYNTKPFLKECVSSVLSQSYADLEYILVDNGCTDGSSQILQEYAAMDKRVKLVCYETNRKVDIKGLLKSMGTGKFFAIIDSDDWWEPDYLERLIGFLTENDLDLAVTGTYQFFQKDRRSVCMRQLETPVIMTQHQFAQQYPYFWVFPSTGWGSIMKRELYLQADLSIPVNGNYPYGSDTMTMLQYIRQCDRIGIDNSALYHYRIHPKSVTFQYNPRRFDANIVYYEQIREFLELHQTFDTEKSEWLKQVHLDSMSATLKLLRDTDLPSEQKLEECLRIRQHPLTEIALTSECEPRDQWFVLMWEILSMALADTNAAPAAREKLTELLYLLSPDCSKAFRPEEIELLCREPALWEAVKAADEKQLAGLLLKLIAEKRFSKQYDLGAIFHRLLPKGSVLREIEDTRFFRAYAQDCAELLEGNPLAALDHMTELLLESKKLYAPEQFLNVYLSLAALAGHAEAFVFGKLQLAKLYLREGRQDDCRAAARELAEMGLENEDFAALCRELCELEAQA